MKRFKETKMSILDCRDKLAIKAFIKGLLKTSKFYKSPKVIKPITFDKVLERVEDAMEYEEKLQPRSYRSSQNASNSGGELIQMSVIALKTI